MLVTEVFEHPSLLVLIWGHVNGPCPAYFQKHLISLVFLHIQEYEAQSCSKSIFTCVIVHVILHVIIKMVLEQASARCTAFQKTVG